MNTSGYYSIKEVLNVNIVNMICEAYNKYEIRGTHVEANELNDVFVGKSKCMVIDSKKTPKFYYTWKLCLFYLV